MTKDNSLCLSLDHKPNHQALENTVFRKTTALLGLMNLFLRALANLKNLRCICDHHLLCVSLLDSY